MVTLNPIGLTPKTSTRNGGVISKGLDILSSILLEPTTFIKDPVKAGKLVSDRRAKIRKGEKGEFTKVIAETITSTALAAGAILGGGTVAGRAAVARFAPKLIPKTVKGGLLTSTAGGILLTSPTARRLVSGTIQDPTKTGREAGELIERIANKEDTGSFKDIVKKAGVAGGAIALGAGAIGVGKALIGDKSPSDVPSSLALPSTPIPNALTPITDEPVVATAAKPAVVPKPSVNVKVINKPQINLAVAQSL